MDTPSKDTYIESITKKKQGLDDMFNRCIAMFGDDDHKNSMLNNTITGVLDETLDSMDIVYTVYKALDVAKNGQ
jgi:hypothetical protein